MEIIIFFKNRNQGFIRLIQPLPDFLHQSIDVNGILRVDIVEVRPVHILDGDRIHLSVRAAIDHIFGIDVVGVSFGRRSLCGGVGVDLGDVHVLKNIIICLVFNFFSSVCNTNL